MKKVLIIAAFFFAGAARAAWVFEGTWGSQGSGNGQFMWVTGVAVAPNGNVYVSDQNLNRIQYFTATGFYIGGWAKGQLYLPVGVAVAPEGNVYVADQENKRGVKYFTATGSYLGSFVNDRLVRPYGVAFNPAGSIVWVSDFDKHALFLFTPTGSLIRSIQTGGRSPVGLDVCPRDRAYVAMFAPFCQVLCYDEYGRIIYVWGSYGSGNGQFNMPFDIAVAPNGYVFVADYGNDRIQYFTASGSFLGKWGSTGSGPGQFRGPWAVAFNADGSRLYVADNKNCRVQYFKWVNVNVGPASLGRVKALFR
jgi:DNA-binding beta-propeller fold protein YncE